MLMSASSRRVRSAVVFAIFGVATVILFHLAGGENGTEGGYVEHPVARLMTLVAWGALIGGALGWLAEASPLRATIPVGLAFVSGIVGFVVGVVVGVNVVGDPLIDGNTSRLLTSALIGTGVGWSIGASVGLVLARPARPTLTESRVLRSTAFAAVLVGLAAAWFETSLIGPGGLRARYLPSLQAATIADAVLVGLILVIVAGRARATPPQPSSAREIAGAFRRRLGKAGVIVGCLLSIAVFAIALQTRAAVATAIQRGANMRTADILAAVAANYQEENGAYPADLDGLLASGGEIEDGSFVNFAGAVRGGFCVRVGTEIGGDYGGPPYSSAVVHPRPPKAHSWTAAESWVGDSCRSATAGRTP